MKLIFFQGQRLFKEQTTSRNFFEFHSNSFCDRIYIGYRIERPIKSKWPRDKFTRSPTLKIFFQLSHETEMLVRDRIWSVSCLRGEEARVGSRNAEKGSRCYQRLKREIQRIFGEMVLQLLKKRYTRKLWPEYAYSYNL